MAKIQRPFSEEDDEELLRLRNEGKTCEQIGQKLNRSKASIQARLNRNKWYRTVAVKHANRTDYVGQQFGLLRVIGEQYVKDKGHMPLCKCECGKEVVVESYQLRRGLKRSCGCKQYERLKHLTGKNNPNFTGFEEIPGSFWGDTVSGAKKRGYQFNLSIQDAWNLVLKQEKRCALSGFPLSFGPRRFGLTASLDRIDSSKGYELENVQWVHKVVNIMKSLFDEDLFVNFCRRIASNEKLKSIPDMTDAEMLPLAMVGRIKKENR